jgi:hypothetical protein
MENSINYFEKIIFLELTNGVCKLDGKEISDQKAFEFIIKANEIISLLKSRLPKELHWKEFKHVISLEGIIPIIEPEKK